MGLGLTFNPVLKAAGGRQREGVQCRQKGESIFTDRREKRSMKVMGGFCYYRASCAATFLPLAHTASAA